MCFSKSKAPAPPPPPPMAPPVLEQEAPSLVKDDKAGSKELSSKARGTTKYKNKINRGNTGSGLGAIKKKGA